MSSHYQRLSPWRMGFAVGLIWSLTLFVLALIAHNTIFYGHPFIQALDSVYIGYSPTVEGAFIGLCWGFIDFFIFGWLVTWVYNLVLPKHKG